jgi:hypothetical protein
MGGEDYANWGSDDSYVIHFICSKLGLTPLSDITPPVPPENVTPASDPNEINYIENIPVDIL